MQRYVMVIGMYLIWSDRIADVRGFKVLCGLLEQRTK